MSYCSTCEGLSIRYIICKKFLKKSSFSLQEDILSALIVDQDPKGHPLHTVYSTGVLTFEDGHLHKTIVTLVSLIFYKFI